MLLDEVAAHLETQGVGVVKTASNDPVWPIHKGGLHPGTVAHPDDALALTEGPGGGPIRQMDATLGAVAAETPSLVLHARSAAYEVARAKIETAWRKLHNFSGSLSGVRYLLIEARQQPFPIGRDDANRWIFGCNFDVTKEQS